MSRFSFNKLTNNPGRLIIVVFAVALLAGMGGGWLIANNNDSKPSLDQQKKIVTSQSNLISEIAKTVGPSVVSINLNITDNSSGGFFGYSGGTAQAAGTGIILTTDGVIVTNRHVVPEGSSNVAVTLSDGTEYKDVEVLGRTSETDSLDVAFLKIKDTNGKKLTPASIGDSSNLQVGDGVVAIGNALGQFQNTVTSGIISGFGRSVQAGSENSSDASESLVDLLQTDAAINQGNSGGPLVNMNGQVIGINTAVAGDGAENIGFAIPINNVKGLINQVLKDGKFSRPYLGVRYIPLTPSIAKQLDLSVNYGAYIPSADQQSGEAVISGSPAEKAGLKEKDVIIAVDGKKIDQNNSLTALLSTHAPGDKIELTVLRDGKTIKLSATLGSQPTSNQ